MTKSILMKGISGFGMEKYKYRKKRGLNFFLVASLILFASVCSAQKPEKLHFFENPDTLHPQRFWVSISSGAAIYSGLTVGLWEAWYSDFPRSGFQLFNDWKEWEQVDKVGHLYSAYIQAKYTFNGARWTGMSRKSSIWTGVAVGTGLQMTFEIMDGFSEKWGFSIPDVIFNTAGVALFASQEWAWQEQRIRMKVSSNPVSYPDFQVLSVDQNAATTLRQRAEDLYGTSFGEVFIKDYNAQINWASVNIWSFLPERKASKFPRWLNVAVGYGAGNLYGGFGNYWTDENGNYFEAPGNSFPRYRRYLLSLDLDLGKIKTRSRFLNTALEFCNFLKVPFPALEYNSLGQLKFYPVYW